MAENGLVQGMPQNEATPKSPRNRSKFPMSYPLFSTHRFAEITPHFVYDGEAEDTTFNKSSHKVQSYTLQSPLMQNIEMKKDYFMVPKQAILPRNWEKVYTNPVIGDDVPSDAGTSVTGFWTKVNTMMTNWWTEIYNEATSAQYTIAKFIQGLLRFLVVGEYFYSNGNVLTNLGCHGATHTMCGTEINDDPQDTSTRGISYDKFFDLLCGRMLEVMRTNGCIDIQFTDSNGKSYVCSPNGRPVSGFEETAITFREMLDIMRDDPCFTITAIVHDTESPDYADLYDMISTAEISFQTIQDESTVDLARILAYQIICWHYYTNDHVDYIYTAELYRQYMEELVRGVYNTTNTAFIFTINGLTYQYDALSAHNFITAITNANLLTSTNIKNLLFDTIPARATQLISYIAGIFAYRRSLRFLDYFTGSRVRPLAIGNVDVNVNSNKVSILDVTQNIQRQRFLNAVNRAGRKFSNYIKELFGSNVPHDWHNPLYLAHTTDIIYGEQSEYTAGKAQAEQQNITAVLRSNGYRYAFEFDLTMPCIVIGVTHYDIKRVYTKSVERQFFIEDRFDMFNPFLQHVGDQAIYQGELGLSLNTDRTMPFSYTLHDMQYKQRYAQAAGGFVENLPGYIFPADLNLRLATGVIDPDFIRSFNAELDKFYLSLTGYSQGSYFHFIVENDNTCESIRNMIYAPSIL